MITREDFGKDFKWGVSTSAYQIEGAHSADGKGASIWDVFANTKGKIFKGHNANTSCDFYSQYARDITLMYELNIPNFRFSLSWSRIIPNGTGAINVKGIDYYNRVINFCLELGIEPWITLYHWDLPFELHKKGGWTNRDIIYWFGDFVKCCIENFGDRIKYWMILNEPMVFTGAGYFLGIHAPGKKGLSNFLAASHHAALCQAEGGRIIRSFKTECKIGTTFSCSHIEPFRQTEKDIHAAVKADALLNRMFIEPLLGMGYPKDLKLLQRMEPYIKQCDESKLSFDMDFIGIQNYTREIVSHDYFTPLIQAKIIKAHKRTDNRTEMNWEVYPESIYFVLKKFGEYPNIKEIIVTENGAAFPDLLTGDNKVLDEKRINYLNDYIAQVLRARQNGVNVNGYFVWTLVDNFEWAEGYHPRFGLIYVDFVTNQRIIKSSGFWYSKFLEGISTSMSVKKELVGY